MNWTGRSAFDKNRKRYHHPVMSHAPPIFDGKMSDKKRKQLVDAFQAKTIPMFLLSMRSGECGITLTSSHHVFSMDSWWGVFSEEQLYGRFLRASLKHVINIWLCTIQEAIFIGRLIRGKQLMKMDHAKKFIPDLAHSVMNYILRMLDDLSDLRRNKKLTSSDTGLADMFSEWEAPILAELRGKKRLKEDVETESTTTITRKKRKKESSI